MIYVMPLSTGWTCVSVIDATDDFAALRIPLVITIFISVIIIAVFFILLGASEKKSRKIRESAVRTERAMAANEAKTSFLSNMSHEIRTPINAILGMNEIILRESDDDSILGYSENIKSAGSSLLGIINDVLDFSKIEAGKIEILPVDYDLSSVINDLVNMIQVRAESKHLDLELYFDKDIPRSLNGDEVRIKQVITNILTNAVKYTEKGTVRFSMGYEHIENDDENILLKVSVKDTGIGIKQEDIHKLFSKFERIEEKRNRNIEGTGLGMNITQSLLSLMGSSLEVTSAYGKGSVFGFSLKQKVNSWEPLGDYEASYRQHIEKQGTYKQKFTAEKAQILVVDDNPMNLVVFTSLLKRTKIKIDTADNGDNGIVLTRNKKYDLIFLDHMMPEKDGIETLREIRKENDNPNISTPYVCLTANAISGAREQYIEAGFDDYLTKPVDSDKLEQMLLQYIPEDKIEKIKEATGEEKKKFTEEDIPEELIAIDGDLIDVKAGLNNNGSPELYNNVLKMFFNSINHTHKMLSDLFGSDSYEEYTIKVHALKSSARIVGAAAFGEEAQKLEDAGKAGDFGYIREHNREFLDHYLEFGELLAGLFDCGKEQAERPVADPELLSNVYEEIRSAADDMDCDRLENIFKEMDEYSIPKEEEELYTGLKEATWNYDYDGILSLLNNNDK
ncbi:MAG: response regulator [Lachnospiraceae bacterium]|nr:response regulator [Lachnospiraceae bacterium]